MAERSEPRPTPARVRRSTPPWEHGRAPRRGPCSVANRSLSCRPPALRRTPGLRLASLETPPATSLPGRVVESLSPTTPHEPPSFLHEAFTSRMHCAVRRETRRSNMRRGIAVIALLVVILGGIGIGVSAYRAGERNGI